MEEVLAARLSGNPDPGRLLFVEHPHVITVTRRPEAHAHVLAPPGHLSQLGVELCPTDRGGDVTYHGPGQIVVYPILDIDSRRLRIGDYLRLLEQAVIDTCTAFSLPTMRDPAATGVWTIGPDGSPGAKLCAIGVRVKRWITLHGLAVNVEPDLEMFRLIVPCGLAGRPVTSLRHELGTASPPVAAVRQELAKRLREHLRTASPAQTAEHQEPSPMDRG